MVAEETILQEGGITVTTARVSVMGMATYPVANITSVRTRTKRPKRALPILLGIAGAALQLMLVVMVLDEQTAEAIMGTFLCSGVSLAMMGLAALMLVAAKTRHYVLLGAGGGEVQVISSRDREFAARVTRSIEQAILHQSGVAIAPSPTALSVDIPIS